MFQINWQISPRSSRSLPPIPSTPDAPLRRVSAGVIAGAVIGSVAGIVLIAATALFVWRRKRQGGRPTGELAADGDHEWKPVPQTVVDARSPVEMVGSTPEPTELPGSTPPSNAPPSGPVEA